MTYPYTIALCCNGSLLPGLHATLASLTRNLSQREKVSLHLFIRDIDAATRKELELTVADAGGVGRFEIREADISGFEDARTLHGDRTIYLRLKLPDLLPEAPTIVYLDSDLVVKADVCEMFTFPLGDNALGAIPAEMVRWSLDADVFHKLGLNDEGNYFNSGVLLINAAQWRKQGVIRQILDFARAHGPLLRSHDQTILNALFSLTYFHLPTRFNTPLGPSYAVAEGTDNIFHFMGSPKPWDPFGRLMHNNWRLWDEEIKTSRFRWSDYLARYGSAYAARTWALRKSYLREMKTKAVKLIRGRKCG